MPSAAKMATISTGPEASAKPSALPSSGAVQGVARKVASTPVAKLPSTMPFPPASAMIRGSGISNRPQRLAANSSRIAAMPARKTGDWNCTPQPTYMPAAIVLRAAGMYVGWGVQFQSPVFLAGMAAILLLFAANLWGLFEIPLPRIVADAGGTGVVLGNFATGVPISAHSTQS